jgi:hypothetical protein
MRLLANVAVVALIGAAGEARAADDWAMGADLRCVVAFGALIGNPTYHDAAASGLFYYLGRLEGRDPEFDLGKGLRQVRSAMQSSQFVTEAQRCGAELKAKNDFLKTLAPPAAVQHRGVG